MTEQKVQNENHIAERARDLMGGLTTTRELILYNCPQSSFASTMARADSCQQPHPVHLSEGYSLFNPKTDSYFKVK